MKRDVEKDDVTKDDVTKDDVMKYDVTKCDVTGYSVIHETLPCNGIIITVVSLFLFNIFIINQK
jgi:hypothetical protein